MVVRVGSHATRPHAFASPTDAEPLPPHPGPIGARHQTYRAPCHPPPWGVQGGLLAARPLWTWASTPRTQGPGRIYKGIKGTPIPPWVAVGSVHTRKGLGPTMNHDHEPCCTGSPHRQCPPSLRRVEPRARGPNPHKAPLASCTDAGGLGGVVPGAGIIPRGGLAPWSTVHSS